MPNKILRKFFVPVALTIWAVFPFWAKAEVYINEIMYDIEGSDDKKSGLRFIMILPAKSV